MKLINNSKSKITTSKGDFKVGAIMDFSEEEARTLTRYPEIKKVADLEEKTPKKEFSKKEKSDK